MRRGVTVGAVLAVLLPVAAAEAATPRPIVYAVVIDGLDGDRVDEGKAPFMSSLLDGHATYYRESRSVMIAETNPNHVAMMTGAYGNASGFPGNAFALYAPLANASTCQTTGPADESKPPTPTSGECRTAETLFEAIRRRVSSTAMPSPAAIFGKPKLGRIFQNSGVDHLWAPCASGDDDDAYCGQVPTNPITGYAVDDRTVMDEVIRTICEGVGARHRRPDFTFVNLHQVDSAGHATGTGAAYDAAIAQADDEIARLVGELQSRGEWQRTVLILLSDHSMDTTLVKTNLKSAFTAGGISSDDFVIVQNGSVDLVYLAAHARARAAALRAPVPDPRADARRERRARPLGEPQGARAALPQSAASTSRSRSYVRSARASSGVTQRMSSVSSFGANPSSASGAISQ